ncbi:MAG TPA: peptide chain release factor 2 [Actinomycetota bacterium]|nr:peptide chain release factor 2 [Actinomycetota bacterium]
MRGTAWAGGYDRRVGDFTERIEHLSQRIASAKEFLDVEAKCAQVAELERQASDPSLWDDPARGQQLTTRLARLRADVDRFQSLERRLADARAIDELLGVEADPELERELEQTVTGLETEIDRLELTALLGGEYDHNDAVATLHAGAGGTESQDWAEMLLRMYLRWAERHGFDVEVDEILPGEEAGIKSATFIVHGFNAYGLLSTERGVHRLVRISPFDAAKRRHTSFASLDVIPLLEETDEEDIEIDPKDLRIDVYRSTGPGGQSVNTTDSAVRITHLPTGITAACQNERSQLQNRAVAMRILKARLAERMRREQQQKLEALRGERRGIDFGSQIRSYVLAPYRLVKDHRTNLEISDVDGVLDGAIDELIEAELRRRAEEGRAA